MIHQYKLGQRNIVLDIASGAIHQVDDLAYDVIAMYETSSAEEIVGEMLCKYRDDPEVDRQEILDVLSDIEELKEAGQLFTPDDYRDLAVNFKAGKNIVKALCLHVAHTCNLTCDYCFAREGQYHGERALMPFEVGRQALDFLIASSGTRRNLEVDFFGGEPLLNWEVVKQLVSYGRSQEAEHGKRFRFTLTTNGMCLDDEVMDFANREMDNVVLSLDGRRGVHDHFRKTSGGKGSYDVIVPKFKRLVESRGERGYYIRGTFTHMNTDFTQDIFHMADLGFTQLSMEPVVCAPGDPYALTDEDLPKVMEQYEILAAEMERRNREGNGFTFYHYMLDFDRGPCIYKRITGCGAGTEYLAVTPWGELFPCHQFVGDSKYSMGDVWQGVTNAPVREEMACTSVYSRPECRECWARLYCSGGCAANAYHATGDVLGVYSYGCELFKKRMECAIVLGLANQRAD